MKTIIIFLLLVSASFAQTTLLRLFGSDIAWTPSNATETLLLQFEGDTPPTSDSWADVSGNAKDITFSNSPTLGTLNGYTTVILNGSNQYGQTAVYSSLEQPLSIYIVLKVLTYATDKTIIDGSSGGTGNQCRIFMTGGSPAYQFNGGAVVNINPITTGQWTILRIVHNGASSSIRVDNGSPITGNGGSNNMSQFLLGRYGWGAAQHPNIEVAAIIVYGDAVSASTDASLMSYLSGKYGL